MKRLVERRVFSFGISTKRRLQQRKISAMVMKERMLHMNTYITGAVIKQLRENRSMTQSDLAEQIGVSSKTVSKWETLHLV